MGEHPSELDVGDEDHRTIDMLGKSHVGDIVGAQVDLRRRTRALDDHGIETRGQAPVSVEYRRTRDAFVSVVAACIHIAHCMTLDDDLRTSIRVRFEQHQIHIDPRLQSAGDCLQRLGPPDLASVRGHGTVRAMFWGLKGATRTPCWASQRHRAVTSRLLPAFEVVPCTINVRAVTSSLPPHYMSGGMHGVFHHRNGRGSSYILGDIRAFHLSACRASAYKFLTEQDLSAVVVIPSGSASLLCQTQGGGLTLKQIQAQVPDRGHDG